MPKVDGFADAAGIQHKPGEIVDLPERYATLNWLEPVEKKPKVKVPPAKVEPVKVEPVPLEAPKEARKKRKAK